MKIASLDILIFQLKWKKMFFRTNLLLRIFTYTRVKQINQNYQNGQSIGIYQKLKQADYLTNEHKTTNIKFFNYGRQMLVYPIHPRLINPNGETNKPNLIMAESIVSFSFLDDVNEEMEVNQWDNRKAIYLNIRQVMKLLTLGPKMQKNIEIQMKNAGTDLKLGYNVRLDYEEEKKQIKLDIQHFKGQGSNSSSIWDINFLFSLNEFLLLKQWIRSTIYYTSGTAAMVQYSKQRHLLQSQRMNRSKRQ